MNDLVIAKDFGRNFHWGVAIAAAQNEGAPDADGRGASIWDVYSKRIGKIKDGGKPAIGAHWRRSPDLLPVVAQPTMLILTA